jgi:magnesium transporter
MRQRRGGVWEHGPVDGYVIATDGSCLAADPAAVERLLGAGELFWLDLHRPTDADMRTLTKTLGVHPLAARAAVHFGQRPKLEEFDDFTFVVAYGATARDRPLTEVHCFYSARYLVTVTRRECPALRSLRERIAQGELPARFSGKHPSRLVLLHHILDTLAESFFPVLAGLDDRIDGLQDEILDKPTDAQLGELFQLKRWLIGVRKVVTAQRDMLASLTSGVTALPGMTRETERYIRDLYDHMIRISDLVDSYRDLLTSAMDSYLSTVSNRLNQVMKQLTVIATIFLPLSFLTGFFGQNFGWLVSHINGLGSFAAIGIGTEVAAVAVLVALFRRRGWL